MYTADDVATATEILSAIPEFGWLMALRGKQEWVPVAAIAEGYGQSRENVERLCAVVPGAYIDDATSRWRIPWSGLVVYFARKVSPHSFRIPA